MLYISGAPIGEVELQNLKQEVRTLKQLHIWRIMQETVRNEAIEYGFFSSTDWERTLAGKMMVHNLGLLKSMVDAIEKYTIPQVPPTAKKKSYTGPSSLT